MEQGDLLSVGSDGRRELSALSIVRRFATAGKAARRGAPGGPGEPACPRGDHDLNPDLYEPGRPLVSAAVLVPLIERPDTLNVLFTRRTDHLRDHAGQISFPGGRIHAHDPDPESAALREAEEEVGLPPELVESIGRLDTYVTRTGFEITPVVGLVRQNFTCRPDSFEVAEVFEVPLHFFCSPDACQRHSRLYRGRVRYFYAFPYRQYYIWGATAGMLVNLAEILRDPPC